MPQRVGIWYTENSMTIRITKARAPAYGRRSAYMFLEIIKAILMGIRGGHHRVAAHLVHRPYDLAGTGVKFNASEEFMSMSAWSSSWVPSLQWWCCSGASCGPSACGMAASSPSPASGSSGSRWSPHTAGAGHQPVGRLDGGSHLQLHHRGRNAHPLRCAVPRGGEPPHCAPRHPSGTDHLP